LLNSVNFPELNTGWAVVSMGTIIKTTNGGTNWESQVSGTTTQLFSVYFNDTNIGWAVGDSGKILKTTNSGVNWESQTSGTSSILLSVYFVDSNIGWTVGSSGTILKTTDGGLSWFNQTSGTSSSLESVHFVNSNIGWIAGYNASTGKGIILKATDGGVNWESQLNRINPWLNSIYILNDQTGWAVGEGGAILKTTNGGVTFIQDEDNNFDQPVDYLLKQNYPNPFNPTTILQYAIGSRQFVTLKVYDLLGREIATLVNEEKLAGTYRFKFDGTGLPSGVYFYQFRAGNFVETKKMVLMK
jgi:hypothetical protein